MTEPPSQRPFEAIAAVSAPPTAATSGASDGVTATTPGTAASAWSCAGATESTSVS